jgi:hypothetical protein
MTRLMSFCTRPTVAAKKAVIAPISVRQFEQRRHAGDEEDASRDHGCGMNEGRHRGRAFHRVRQPSVQQELRRFTHGAHEEQQAHARHRIGLVQLHAEQVDDGFRGGSAFSRQIGRGSSEDRFEIDRAEQHEHAANAENEAEVTDAVDDEGLHGGSRCGRLLEPEADQQIGRQTHAFPAEEHLQQVVGGHQHQHGEGEERQIGEETRTMRIVVHVSDRIEMHQRRNRVDHDEHDGRQRVDAERPFDIDAAGLDPAQHGDLDHLTRLAMGERDGEEHDPRQDGDHDHQTGGDIFRSLGADRAAEQAGDQEADQWKKDDSLVDHSLISPSSY